MHALALPLTLMLMLFYLLNYTEKIDEKADKELAELKLKVKEITSNNNNKCQFFYKNIICKDNLYIYKEINNFKSFKKEEIGLLEFKTFKYVSSPLFGSNRTVESFLFKVYSTKNELLDEKEVYNTDVIDETIKKITPYGYKIENTISK